MNTPRLVLSKSTIPGYCGGNSLVVGMGYDDHPIPTDIAAVGLSMFPSDVEPLVMEAEHTYDYNMLRMQRICVAYRIKKSINGKDTGTVLDDLEQADKSFDPDDLRLHSHPMNFCVGIVPGLTNPVLYNFGRGVPRSEIKENPHSLGKLVGEGPFATTHGIVFHGTSPLNRLRSASAEFLLLLYRYGSVVDIAKEFPWMGGRHSVPLLRVKREDYVRYVKPLMNFNSDLSRIDNWTDIYVTLMPPLMNKNYNHRTFMAVMSLAAPIIV